MWLHLHFITKINLVLQFSAICLIFNKKSDNFLSYFPWVQKSLLSTIFLNLNIKKVTSILEIFVMKDFTKNSLISPFKMFYSHIKNTIIINNDPTLWNILNPLGRIYNPCGQFHQHFSCKFYIQKFIQSQILSREKTFYEKCVRKTLMKLTPDLLNLSKSNKNIYWMVQWLSLIT